MLKLIAAAALALAMACSSSTPDPAPTPAPAMAEDDPGWDCSTQGNRICGAEHQGQAD